MSHTIIVDNACDITADMKLWTNLAVVPFSADNSSITLSDDLQIPKKLSAVNFPPYIPPSPFLYLDAIKTGGDDIFIIASSDKLSQSYQNAMTAKAMYNEGNKDKNIHVFNSYGFGGVQTLLAMKIKSLIDAGSQFNAIVTLTEYTSANKTECFLCPNNIKMFSLQPFIQIKKLDSISHFGSKLVLCKSPDGRLVKHSHITFGKNIVNALGNKILLTSNNYGSEKKKVVISYIGDDNTAVKVKEFLDRTNKFDAVLLAKTNDFWATPFCSSIAVSIAV